ncbi:MAG: hypothetical protein WBZ36_22580 [Candidatus Nitrosopolaris sp.]|jgi:hypothetical protein
MAIEDIMRYHETGFTTWDLADIYGPAEDFIRKFRLKLSKTIYARTEPNFRTLNVFTMRNEEGSSTIIFRI